MEPTLVTNAYVRSSDKGHVSIPEAHFRSSNDSRALADKLSAEYAKLVKDNPTYQFSIVHDAVKEIITVSWHKR